MINKNIDKKWKMKNKNEEKNRKINNCEES